MGTTAEKLTYLNDTKTAIKEAIVNKGVTVADTDTFRSYADKIGNISSEVNNQTKTITENGTYTADDGYTGLGTVTVDVDTTVSFPNLTEISESCVVSHVFPNCTGLTSVSFPNLTTIYSDGINGAFSNCKSLTSVLFPNLTEILGDYAMKDTFSGTNLKSVAFPKLTEISGCGTMYYTFAGTPLTSIVFPVLSTINCDVGAPTFMSAFTNCSSLTSISFPALTSSSFGDMTNQFGGMLGDVTGCTVHFPSNLESVIGSWSDVTAGFDGTDTTVLYDLDATE